MTQTLQLSAEALHEARLSLRVSGDDGHVISASIWPTRLTANQVSGVVEWNGTELMSSIVSAEGEESDWGQLFLLVWAAAGPTSVAAVPILGTTQWRLANLTLPDIRSQPGGTVHVSLKRSGWTATLSTTHRHESQGSQQIPPALQRMDAGSLLAEMASRLLLKKPWLTAGEHPE